MAKKLSGFGTIYPCQMTHELLFHLMLLLHAQALAFEHPASDVVVRVESPVPF